MDDLERLEHRFWKAAGDPEFYRRHFADDGLCVFGFGVLDRDATVASMTEAQPWTDLRMQDVRTIRLGPGAAALTYDAQAARGDVGYRAMVSSTYVHRDGRWQLILHQQTPRSPDA